MVLLWVGLDMLQIAQVTARASDAAEPGPPGFIQKLAGIGDVETSFRGRTVLVAEDRQPMPDGRSRFIPRYRVEGLDPEPVADGAAMDTVVIHSLEAPAGDSAHTSFTVTAPRAWMPLDSEADSLTFDMQSLWQLESPIFEMPDFTDGHPLRLEADHADLDPAEDLIFGRGPFTMTSGNLSLTGSDLFFDPQLSRVEFQPLDGVLRWSILGADGAVYSGECDGPGAFFPEEGGGYRLELHAIDRVSSFFPKESAMPGRLQTRDLALTLQPSADGRWQPASAEADGPTYWSGQTLHMDGAHSFIRWDDAGEMQDLTVFGPVRVEPTDRSFDWASAEKLACFTPADESVRMEGAVSAKHERGILKGDWANLAPQFWRVGGQVRADGLDGSGSSDLLETDRQGNWWLTGDAELRPLETDVEWLRSPLIHFTEDGLVRTDATFSMLAVVDGEPLMASGNGFESRMMPGPNSLSPDVRRTQAEGDLQVDYLGHRLNGHRLTQTGEKTFEVTAERGGRVNGSYDFEGHQALLDCGHLKWTDGAVEVLKTPRIQLPAEAMNLQGEMVEIHAKRMLQDNETGAWHLLEDVRFGGALKGDGHEALVIPRVQMRLDAEPRLRDGKPATAWISGVLENGATFTGRGETLTYFADSRLAIDRQAFASYQGVDEDQPIELYGDFLEFREDQGWARGSARFTSPDLTGHADRLDWTRQDDEESLLILVGNARLLRQTVEALGPRIELDTRAGTMTSIGNRDHPARLRAADGRNMVGDWLRYNLNTGLFDSRGANFDTD